MTTHHLSHKSSLLTDNKKKNMLPSQGDFLRGLLFGSWQEFMLFIEDKVLY